MLLAPVSCRTIPTGILHLDRASGSEALGNPFMKKVLTEGEEESTLPPRAPWSALDVLPGR